MSRRRLKNLIDQANAAGWGHWIQGPADELALLSGHWFDTAAAERPRQFFSRFLKHSTGEFAGRPFDLLDWQWRGVIGPMFGWRRPNGLRRFDRSFIFIPKKNGKTTLAGGIALYLTIADYEPRAEVYAAATTKAQAGIVYNEASHMVKASPDLLKRMTIHRNTKTLVHEASGSFFRVLPHGADSAEGLNIHGLIFDELHAQRDRALFDCLRYAGAARRQPLLVSITTAGDRMDSICYEEYSFAKKVLSGDIDAPSFLPFIAEAGPDDDWTDPATWRKANPSLGITIQEDKFRADMTEALNSPAKQNSFSRYRLNKWVGAASAWLSLTDWRKPANAGDPNQTPEALRAEALARLVGRECIGGLDMANTQDLACFGLLFRCDDDPEAVEFIPWFFVPEDRAQEREKRDKVPYITWARRGFITLTPGNSIDYKTVRATINALTAIFKVREIAADQWQAEQLIQELANEDGLSMIGFKQNLGSMAPPSKELERLVLAGKIRHQANPVLQWMAANVVADTNSNGDTRPNRRKSTDKIDGIVTLVMTIGRQIAANITEAKPPPYIEQTGGALITLD